MVTYQELVVYLHLLPKWLKKTLNQEDILLEQVEKWDKTVWQHLDLRRKAFADNVPLVYSW